MKIDQSIDAINACCTKYVLTEWAGKAPTFKKIHFTGFKPEQTSTILIAQIYGQTFEDDILYYVQICISREDLQGLNTSNASSFLKERLDRALQILQEFTEDPFDVWVKEVRSGSVSDTD